MLAVNPYKASIAALLFMSEEQRGILDEVTQYFDAMAKRDRIAFDKDRAALERLGVW
jgi:hypothetical protein